MCGRAPGGGPTELGERAATVNTVGNFTTFRR
jgi:hypothetical protein